MKQIGAARRTATLDPDRTRVSARRPKPMTGQRRRFYELILEPMFPANSSACLSRYAATFPTIPIKQGMQVEQTDGNTSTEQRKGEVNNGSKRHITTGGAAN